MEHGRDRHVDIRRGETQRGVVAAHADADTHGVKNDLAMGEINPFGKAGCPRCVERGGLCVFVQDREIPKSGEAAARAPRIPRHTRHRFSAPDRCLKK